jgi:polyisoprenyl-teichoic acid--peptidoglycan teichoic acid transferase
MRLRLLHLALLIVLLSTTGCNVPSIISSVVGSPITSTTNNNQSQAAISYVLVTSDPNATPTATPFQPIFQSITSFPTLEPTNLLSPSETTLPPTATLPAPTEISAANTLEVNPINNQVNILLLGSDLRPDDYGFRTDVIMWVSLNPSQGTVSIISFPRDLWVYIPDWGYQRINTAQVYGFSTTQQTFQYNFGITPDHYVLTNFSGFKTIIDTLGGVDVNVAETLTDECNLPEAIATGTCTVNPGIVHMDGAKALWYVRSRYSTSDVDRTRRAQEVILATFQRLMSLNAISKADELYAQIKDSVETDLSFTDLLSMVPLALQLTDTSKIKRYYIGYGQVYDWTTSDGAMVLVPIQSACEAVIQEALNP